MFAISHLLFLGGAPEPLAAKVVRGRVRPSVREGALVMWPAAQASSEG
jgi:hypothetical protein